jgi:hypothetical protein
MPTLNGMKSLVLLALAFVVVAIVPPAISQSTTTTEIPFRTEEDRRERERAQEPKGPTSRSYSAGNPQAESDDPRSRKIVLTVDRTRWPAERIQISIVDQQLRDTLLFEAEGWELLKLKELVDKAVADYRADRENLRAVSSSKEGATQNAED